MKKTTLLIPIMILLALSLSACGSSVERILDSGNQAFVEQAYDEALETYAQAIEMAPTLAEPVYNLANTLYRMEAFEQTGQLMGQALQLASAELAQHGFYNLGNNFFQQQQMDGAIESYKESLRLNPDDLDAKYNLELAMQQQEQQQQEQEEQEQDQQQEQNQSGEDQQEQDQSGEDQQEDDQSGEDQQDQNGGQDPQDQNQDGQEQQDDQGQSGEDQQEQDQQQDPGQNGEQSPEGQEQNAQGQPQQLEGLTEEQARQILAAIGQSTETLQEKLQEIFGVPIAPSGKDW